MPPKKKAKPAAKRKSKPAAKATATHAAHAATQEGHGQEDCRCYACRFGQGFVCGGVCDGAERGERLFTGWVGDGGVVCEPHNLEGLPQLPENWVTDLEAAMSVAINGMVVVPNALHNQQWPTIEHKPKVRLTQLVAVVHCVMQKVSECATVAIRLSIAERDRVLRTQAT